MDFGKWDFGFLRQLPAELSAKIADSRIDETGITDVRLMTNVIRSNSAASVML